MKKETLHIYTRVSTTSQEDEGTSLDAQIENGIKKANDLGMDYEIHNEKSASSFKDTLENRPVISNLLLRMKQGEVKHVYVWNTDRLSRNENTWFLIKKEFKESKCVLHTPAGKTDISSPQDSLIFSIMGSISQYDNAIRTARLKDGKTRRALEGYWHGGAPPFGYQVIDKKLAIHPDEAVWVRKMFHWYGEGKSPRWIKAQIDGEILTRRQKPFWSIGSIEAVIRNSHYSGFYTYHLTNKIPCAKIVDDVDWVKVQTRLDSLKGRGTANNQKHSYMLKGILFCADCGMKMGGTTQRGKSVYRCIDKARRWKESTEKRDWKRNVGCSNNVALDVTSTDSQVFDAVLETLRYSTLTREQFKQTALKEGKITHAQKEKRIKGFERQKKDIGKDLDTIDVKIAQLETDKLLGRKPAKRINAQIKVLDGESKRLTVKRNDIGIQLGKLSDEKLWVDWYADYLQDADDRQEIEGEDRLQLIQKYVEKIDVYLHKEELRHTLDIRFNLPIVGDKLAWINSNRKKEGYKLENGSRTKEIIVKKNKQVVRQNA